MRVFEKAYAKLNLYLDVMRRTDDGFHALESVMQTVSLYDGVTVEATPAEAPSVSFSVHGRYYVPVGEGNLCHRAAMLYMREAAMPMQVKIHLEKRIPVAAGLGGGSADAAAVLRALNRLAGQRFTTPRLLSLAAALGSDVPFCLLGHTRLCGGRGEQMQVLTPAPRIPLVIVPSPERVSTPAAFSLLDEHFGNFSTPRAHGDLAAMLAALTARSRQALGAALYNVFEEVILPRCPIASEHRRRLLECGAEAALMSGSGATVFGIFEKEAEATAAAQAIGAHSVVAFTVWGALPPCDRWNKSREVLPEGGASAFFLFTIFFSKRLTENAENGIIVY